MGIGDWGLGIGDGDWGLANPPSPIPNPQSPKILFIYLIYFYNICLNKYWFLSIKY